MYGLRSSTAQDSTRRFSRRRDCPVTARIRVDRCGRTRQGSAPRSRVCCRASGTRAAMKRSVLARLISALSMRPSAAATPHRQRAARQVRLLRERAANAVPPGRLSRICDHAKTHGIARSDARPLSPPRFAGRDPRWRRASSRTGVTWAKYAAKPSTSMRSAIRGSRGGVEGPRQPLEAERRRFGALDGRPESKSAAPPTSPARDAVAQWSRCRSARR